MTTHGRKGLTLIELMIVIAIIGILAAIAIPNLLQGRIQYNESSAIGALQEYVVAQEIWRKSQFAGIREETVKDEDKDEEIFIPGNNGDYSNADDEVRAMNSSPRAFADNFRNLYYGVPRQDVNTPLRLISRAVADAFYTGGQLTYSAKASTKSTDTPTSTSQPFHGFVFFEDPFMETGSIPGSNDDMGWDVGYGLVAYPISFGRTGNNLFWVGFNRKISMAVPQNTKVESFPDKIVAAQSPMMNEDSKLDWVMR